LAPDLFPFFYFFINNNNNNNNNIFFFNFEEVNEMKTIFLALSDLDALAKISNPGQIVRVGSKTRD